MTAAEARKAAHVATWEVVKLRRLLSEAMSREVAAWKAAREAEAVEARR